MLLIVTVKLLNVLGQIASILGDKKGSFLLKYFEPRPFGSQELCLAKSGVRNKVRYKTRRKKRLV